LHLSSVIPTGLIVESVTEDEAAIAVSARAGAGRRSCPLCGAWSSRVHSRYVRTASDLPCAGKRVELHLIARRFVCDAPRCRRRIFAERFECDVIAAWSRRASRLECIVHHLGLALGGRPAAGLAADGAGQQRHAAHRSGIAALRGAFAAPQTNAAIVKLAGAGTPIREIVRRTGHGRKLVRQVIRGERTDVFRMRQSSLDTHVPLLDEMWEAGCRDGAELWRRPRAIGFGGSLRVVGEWATRRRQAERARERQPRKVPSARTIARLMTTGRDDLSKADTVTVAAPSRGTCRCWSMPAASPAGSIR
jgi:transposase